MIIVITGPTSVGKTKLSIAIAKKMKGEIINADSTQIYKGLDIATAKINKDEMEGINHHLFDIKEITENYTVFDYQKDSRQVIDKLLKQNITPILVGGTGLYIKACLYDYKFNDEIITNQYDNLTNEEIYEQLIKLDPNNIIHKNNRQRLIRAINYCQIYKTPFSSKEKTDKLLYDVVFIGLTTPRDILYERINKRVDVMVNKGLLNEALAIYNSSIRTKAVLTPIGYKELFPYFENKDTLDNCLEIIKKNSRKYAKRQYTWFNNQMNIKWFNVDFNHFDKTIDSVFEYIKKANF
ncbi:MAG: tRNA (adenosine(37)-N6)-dimethylallyltransferase MiaA [Bacilli bacterium]